MHFSLYIISTLHKRTLDFVCSVHDTVPNNITIRSTTYHLPTLLCSSYLFPILQHTRTPMYHTINVLILFSWKYFPMVVFLQPWSQDQISGHTWSGMSAWCQPWKREFSENLPNFANFVLLVIGYNVTIRHKYYICLLYNVMRLSVHFIPYHAMKEQHFNPYSVAFLKIC